MSATDRLAADALCALVRVLDGAGVSLGPLQDGADQSVLSVEIDVAVESSGERAGEALAALLLAHGYTMAGKLPMVDGVGVCIGLTLGPLSIRMVQFFDERWRTRLDVLAGRLVAVQAPVESADIFTRAQGNLSFLLSVIRSGEQLDEAETAVVRDTIERLGDAREGLWALERVAARYAEDLEGNGHSTWGSDLPGYKAPPCDCRYCALTRTVFPTLDAAREAQKRHTL